MKNRQEKMYCVGCKVFVGSLVEAAVVVEATVVEPTVVEPTVYAKAAEPLHFLVDTKMIPVHPVSSDYSSTKSVLKDRLDLLTRHLSSSTYAPEITSLATAVEKVAQALRALEDL
jgi:hypothetical protein